MDEQEWLAGPDPDKMLHYLQTSASERKLRLFAVACCRRIWHLMSDERSRQAVEVTERHIEGRASDDEWKTASAAARRAWGDTSALFSPELYGLPEKRLTPEEFAKVGVLHSTTSASHALGFDAVHAIPGHWGRAMAHNVVRETARAVHEDYPRSPEGPFQAELLRDIIGNPFRPVAIDHALRTPAVLALATAAHDNRILPAGTLDPERLAVLADALEESGCDNPDILGHLRGPGPHVRGCHVLDLLLNKV
jgi:hypothetical protein